MQKLNIEEVQKIIENEKYSPDCKEFINNAIEDNCEFYFKYNLYIIKRIDEFKELRDDCIGLMIDISLGCGYWSYIAIDHDGIRDWLNLGEYEFGESFSSVISKSIVEAGTCSLCNNYVGYKDIHQYSFAGKCCSKCLPEAKKKYEPPGWYN